MPIYSYKCKNGHEQDELRDRSEMNHKAVCKVCGLEMSRVFARPTKCVDPEKNNGIKWRHGKPTKVFHFRDAFCRDCERRTLVDCTNEDKEYDKDAAECEYCGSKNLEIEVPIPSIDRFGERFPYFDRGLGRMLHSKAHRRKVCKELGVVPIDGDMDFSPEVHKIQNKIAEDKKVVEDLNDRLDNHPGFKEYRELKDKGHKPKFKHRRQR